MSTADNHVIRRASVEVTGSVKADAFRFQQEVIVWAHDHLLPELDRIFASLPPTEDSVYIDRLEIDLDSSDVRNWGNDVLGKLKSELVAVLLNRTRSEKARKRDARAEQISERGFFQKLSHYLETGALPWSLAVRSQSALEDEMLRWLASSEIGGLRPQVAQLLQAGNVRARFLSSFSQALLWRVLTVFFDVPEQAWENLYLDSETLRLARRHAPAESRVHFSQDSEPVRTGESRPADLLSSPPEPLSVPSILLREFVDALAANSFFHSEQSEFAAAKSFLTRLVEERQIDAGDVGRMRFHSRSFQLAREAVLKIRAESMAEPKPVQAPSAPDISGRVLEPKPATSDLPASAASLKETERSRRESAAVEGIFIQNAGLILLAPFLPTLLERVALASEGKLMDPGTAMALMHYLACGEENPAEFQVILPKVLCGWDIEQQIDLPRTVPEVMKSEARQLLESAIEHWSILKNTSPAGLQEAFLSRGGKISLTAKNDWLLQVEQKSFDMLIQHLPWSFKLVKLSWMTRLLRTEWVD